MSVESMMASNHLILCHPLLLLPSIFPSIGFFSSELALHSRWPKYWSFRFEHQSLQWIFSVDFPQDWLGLSPRDSKESWPVPQFESINERMLATQKESYDKPRQCIKKQRHHFANKGPYSQSYGFSSNHVPLWQGVGYIVTTLCPTLATPWTVAFQAHLFMGFPRQEYWSGFPFPSSGIGS